jgi:hypothetical protein
MRESRTYGSMRGARGNSRPYRDRQRNAGPCRGMIAPHCAALHAGYAESAARGVIPKLPARHRPRTFVAHRISVQSAQA